MPADADLLCEYYITSNLKNKSSASSAAAAAAVAVSSGATDLAAAGDFLINNQQQQENSIDFVKYEKNPMDYLKTKYHLLSTTTTPSPLTTTTTTAPESVAVNGHEAVVKKQQLASNSNDQWLELNWSKIKKTGIGLYNLGNNCYLNATLQCLAYTPPLSQWLVARPHSPACKFKQIKGFCSLCEVERIIFDIFNSPNGCAKPNSLCSNIKSKRHASFDHLSSLLTTNDALSLALCFKKYPTSSVSAPRRTRPSSLPLCSRVWPSRSSSL